MTYAGAAETDPEARKAIYMQLQQLIADEAPVIFLWWGKDYSDPSTFMVLFDSRNLIPVGNTAFSLVGVKPSQAKELAFGLAQAVV